MVKINENYLNLKGSYLFSTIAKKVADYKANNPQADVISLGIGDVTRPIPAAILNAIDKATAEMGQAETFRGYGPEQGYEFLRTAIAKNDYQARGVNIEIDEIFVSDGAKSDCGNIGDIFGTDNVVAICDPVYPVYVDTNIMAGREMVFMPCTKENGFVPNIPEGKTPDVIYLCYPNNPTGATATYEQLKAWVGYANANKSIIFYDAAYEAFITEDLPHSIFEIEGANTCAIEFKSFSKTAGFTGVRCGYTVVPKALQVNGTSINGLWNRRQCTKFNGVSYVIQRAAEAVYSEEGQKEVKANIKYYLNNASKIRNALVNAGISASGGVNAPYVWLKTPGDMTSWELFDLLLEKAEVVGTPGSGFGENGEGYFRLTGFGDAARTEQAIERIIKVLTK